MLSYYETILFIANNEKPIHKAIYKEYKQGMDKNSLSNNYNYSLRYIQSIIKNQKILEEYDNYKIV